MHLRWLPAGLVIVASRVAWPGTAASASIGVGVQANPVSLDSAAHPGGSYTLPALYVVNTGTQAESMSVRVERLPPSPAGPSRNPGSTSAASAASCAQPLGSYPASSSSRPRTPWRAATRATSW